MTDTEIKFEHSSGGIVYHMNNGVTEFLLGKHSGYHKWVLPKGLIEKDESPQNTALREVQEETGVTAKLHLHEPIIKLEYYYYADLGEQKGKDNSGNETVRRVITYQENGGSKVKVKKQVEFYLMEYVSGDPKDHDWEMEDAGWFKYDKALEILSFETEKEALRKAQERLSTK